MFETYDAMSLMRTVNRGGRRLAIPVSPWNAVAFLCIAAVVSTLFMALRSTLSVWINRQLLLLAGLLLIVWLAMALFSCIIGYRDANRLPVLGYRASTARLYAYRRRRVIDVNDIAMFVLVRRKVMRRSATRIHIRHYSQCIAVSKVDPAILIPVYTNAAFGRRSRNLIIELCAERNIPFHSKTVLDPLVESGSIRFPADIPLCDPHHLTAATDRSLPLVVPQD